MVVVHIADDLRDREGHDGDGTNGHILGGGKQLYARLATARSLADGPMNTHTVKEHADEGRVETVLGR